MLEKKLINFYENGSKMKRIKFVIRFFPGKTSQRNGRGDGSGLRPWG